MGESRLQYEAMQAKGETNKGMKRIEDLRTPT